ncbi:MAG: gephyrin-like molybdotransferase Glp [Granulosicoccus sp.]
MIEKQPSCDDAVEPALLPISEARRRLFAALPQSDQHELLPVRQVLHRVLAKDVIARVDVPAQTNSAMDGFAVHRSSIPTAGERSLELAGTAWAGQPFEGVVGEGQAVRIFTGAILPDGTDTVVIQEHAQADKRSVLINADVVAGKNVRLAGEDIRAGEVILNAGHYMEAADIGLLASLGVRDIDVVQRLKVAFFTTGDELVSLDDTEVTYPLPPGMLFDSNRHTLAALLQHPGVEAIDLGIVRDNEEHTRKTLIHASQTADLIVSSGGVSAGEADFVTRVFHDVGQVSFWKLAMRPGRPLAFGFVGKSVFFGLPGNPVAVMVTFLEFVKPAIRYMSGMAAGEPLTLAAVCQSSLRKSQGRVEYQRGVMQIDEKGQLVVTSTGKQGAGRLSSMSKANCLIVIDEERENVKPGEEVKVQPFHGLLEG